MTDGEGLPDFREVVLWAVHRSTSTKTFLSDVLPIAFETKRFPSRLRASAAELASGIIRRRLTLDHLIALFSDRPLRKIDSLLRDILRLSVYEILFVEQVPSRASVSEAVELTRRKVREEFTGFTNAILRALIRAVERERHATAGLPGRAPCASELPIEPGFVVRFDRDVFPDPKTDPAGYLSTAGGMPRWLVERWLRRFDPGDVFGIVEASNEKPPVTIRVNRLATMVDALSEELAAAGVETSHGSVSESLRIESSVELTGLDAFRCGKFYIQDESAMRAPRMVAPREGERVLDLCAAPGGKTTHLAELAGGRTEVVALDISPERLARVSENARRLGITCIRTRLGDARRLDDDLAGRFDAVLADVPCSNTGVLRRRVEARHRMRPEVIAELAELQTRILREALGASRPGGRVVYSTCSIEPEENHDVVGRVLEECPDWRLDLEEEMLPRSGGGDGGYAARLVAR